MNPYLDKQYNPHVKIEILLANWIIVDCLVDTGFSGGIALPKRFREGFHQKPVLYQRYELADGSFTSFSLYETEVKFKSTTRGITLFFTKSSEGLVGIEFLTGFKLVLDLKKFLVMIE